MTEQEKTNKEVNNNIKEIPENITIQIPENNNPEKYTGVAKDDMFNSLRILDSWTMTNIKRHVTVVPTNIPKNKDEQIVFYKNGTEYRLYIWINGTWKYLSFTPPVIPTDHSSVCRAYLAADGFKIPENDDTKVDIETTSIDPDSQYDTTNKKFVAKETGYYLVNASICFENVTDTAIYSVRIFTGGCERSRVTQSASGDENLTVTISDLLYIQKDDYLEIYAYQNGGGSWQYLVEGSANTFLSVSRVK